MTKGKHASATAAKWREEARRTDEASRKMLAEKQREIARLERVAAEIPGLRERIGTLEEELALACCDEIRDLAGKLEEARWERDLNEKGRLVAKECLKAFLHLHYGPRKGVKTPHGIEHLGQAGMPREDEERMFALASEMYRERTGEELFSDGSSEYVASHTRDADGQGIAKRNLSAEGKRRVLTARGFK